MGATLHQNGRTADLENARRLVARVADSLLFQKSPRLREFLLYAAKCTLEDRLLEVREQVIAERVFSRKPELGDQDNIVRAEARNLRKRLEMYFSNEGRDEQTIIVMPKGGYSLAFVSRPSISVVDENQVETEPQKAPPATVPSSEIRLFETPVHSLPAHRRYGILIFGLALTTFFFAGLSFFWYSQNAKLRGEMGVTPAAFPFSSIFKDQQTALIVTSDTGLLQISSLLHRRVSLDEYISRSYPNVPPTDPPNLLRNWNIYEFTDGREMTIANLLLSRSAQFASHIFLRSGHAVQLQDFKENSVVLIGSPISNPWAQLYEDKLNFRCDVQPDGRIIYWNRSPHSHEQQQFPSEDDNQHHRTYARLAFLPPTANAHATLLIAGTTAQATQSAGELMVDQTRFSRSLQTMGIDALGQPRFFEFLIRLDNFVGGAILPEVVAWRVSPAPER
jgi:hypothetical protein